MPAGIAVFSFVAQLLIEDLEDGSALRIARVLVLAVMTAVTVGRQYAGWMISGI